MIVDNGNKEPRNASEKDLALSINLNVFFGDETRCKYRRRTLLNIVTISTAIATSTVTACIIRRKRNYRDLSMAWVCVAISTNDVRLLERSGSQC